MKRFFLSIALLGCLSQWAGAGDICPNCARPSRGAMPETKFAPLSDTSLFQLGGRWTNDWGEEVTLDSHPGRVQVVTLFFAHCSSACPWLVFKMKQLERALAPALRSQVAFTLVSFDSERDTPAVLHDYRRSRQLGPNWTLLHGSAGDVLELAAALDVKFRRESSGQFQHSNVISVLNQNGEIARQETGLTLDSGALAREIEELLKTRGDAHAAH